jgi:hypothetical protein
VTTAALAGVADPDEEEPADGLTVGLSDVQDGRRQSNATMSAADPRLDPVIVAG